jgi:hypothetical protein
MKLRFLGCNHQVSIILKVARFYLKKLIDKYSVFGPSAFVVKVNILFNVVWCPRGTCVENVHIVQTRSVLFFTPHRPPCPFTADTVLLSDV